MQTDFPHVKIPESVYTIVGVPDEGTRVYRRDGSQEESAAWFDVLTELIGPSVSPGGVQMYCPVSRAAVYKRMQDGKLSAFLFHVTHRKTTLFGKNKILRESPYIFIPVSEARAWREELEERALKQGVITQEELEGAKPDWNGEFLEWRNKRERLGSFDELKEDGITVPDLIKMLTASLFAKQGETITLKGDHKTKQGNKRCGNEKTSEL